MEFAHGGEEYDSKYPDGIPTSIEISALGKRFESGLVMYPAGHARNTTADLNGILEHKFNALGRIAVADEGAYTSLRSRLNGLETMSPAQLRGIYNFEIADLPSLD
jgi:2-methylcitrate dehydratase